MFFNLCLTYFIYVLTYVNLCLTYVLLIFNLFFDEAHEANLFSSYFKHVVALSSFVPAAITQPFIELGTKTIKNHLLI